MQASAMSVQGRVKRFRRMAEMLAAGEVSTIGAGVGRPITYKDERLFFAWLEAGGVFTSRTHRATACLFYADYLEMGDD